MRSPTYRYNPETCRYEQSKTSFGSVAGYTAGLVITAFLLFVSLLLIHDFVYDSEEEIAFRKENRALKKHSVILASELEDVQTKLTSLYAKDRELHNKFFAVTTEPAATKTNTQKQILLANTSSFRNSLFEIKLRSEQLISKSVSANQHFENQLIFNANTASKIASIPMLCPVRDLQRENILSGFGTRINPFHKGLYQHTGVDLALPRGTEIIAPASGQIIEVKRSELQAGYGNYIEIDHGRGFTSRFAHLEQINVRIGQKIEKGMVIATSGNSGGSIAPHLHYEIRMNGKPVNPILYMIEDVNSREHEVWISISQKQNQSLD